MFKEIFDALKSIFTWWVIVTPWEQGIRIRIGKHVKLLVAGIHLRIPVLDQIYVQSTRLRYISIPTQSITTKEGKILTVSGGLAYSIKDILKLYQTIHDPEDTIQLMCCGLVASFIETKRIEDISPNNIEKEVSKSLNLESYGLTDIQFKITDWVIVKTYRIIQGEPKNYMGGIALNTITEK